MLTPSLFPWQFARKFPFVTHRFNHTPLHPAHPLVLTVCHCPRKGGTRPTICPVRLLKASNCLVAPLHHALGSLLFSASRVCREGHPRGAPGRRAFPSPTMPLTMPCRLSGHRPPLLPRRGRPPPRLGDLRECGAPPVATSTKTTRVASSSVLPLVLTTTSLLYTGWTASR